MLTPDVVDFFFNTNYNGLQITFECTYSPRNEPNWLLCEPPVTNDRFLQECKCNYLHDASLGVAETYILNGQDGMVLLLV